MKPKLMWLSDSPFNCTGYSRISTEILNGLTMYGWDCTYIGHNIITQPIAPGAKLEDGSEFKFRILGTDGRDYGKNVVSNLIKERKPDIFGTLLDTFMLYPYYMNYDFSPAKTMFYYPTDGGTPDKNGNLPLGCEELLKKFGNHVAMAKFGQKQVKEAHGLDSHHIPHAVHADMFYPLTEKKRKDIRIKWGIDQYFVIGVVARNQPRKTLDRTIDTLKLLCDKYPQVRLFMHTDPTDMSSFFNMAALIKKKGLDNRVLFTGMTYFKGFDYAELNNIYNCMDTFLLTSTGEGFCLFPKTKIVTEKGLKNIEDIKKDEKVSTHTNKFRSVIKIMKREVNENIIKIYPYGSLPIELTSEHPIYAIKKPKKQYKKSIGDIIKKTKPEWIKAGELNKEDCVVLTDLPTKFKDIIYDLKDYDSDVLHNKDKVWYKMGYSRNYKTEQKKIKRFIKLTPQIAEVLGFYIAEGSVVKNSMSYIEFSCGYNFKEMNRVKRIMEKNFSTESSIYGKKDKRLVFSSKILAHFFSDLCGKGAFHKKIPTEIFLGSNKIRRSFLKGFWEGDGSLVGKYHTLTTLSPILANQLLLILSTLKYRNTIGYSKRDGCYNITYVKNFDLTHSNKQWNLLGLKGIAKSIRKIEKNNYNGPVYNLWVDEDNSYVTPSFTVHNCVPIIEAMACEVPVIATNYTTTQELILDHNAGMGIKLDTEIMGSWNVYRGFCNIADAAQKISMLIDNPKMAKQMGKNGRKAILKEYTWDVVIPMWDKYLRGILEK